MSLPSGSTLGRKQLATHESFAAVLARIESIISREAYERAVETTARVVRGVTAGQRVAFAWSGGKDSIALAAVCRRAGIQRCVFGMTDHLEYPAWLRWVTDHMPDGLTVIKNDWNLEWLARHPHMLFPQSAETAAKWFSGVQHKAQAQYYAAQRLDMILLGRRRIDGNYVGRNKETIYRDARGVVRYSPIADWSHELVLASMHYEGFIGAHLPPFYRWPRGFRCGTHAWPARQWCHGIADGWREVYSIDPSIVSSAAAVLPSARAYLEGR